MATTVLSTAAQAAYQAALTAEQTAQATARQAFQQGAVAALNAVIAPQTYAGSGLAVDTVDLQHKLAVVTDGTVSLAVHQKTDGTWEVWTVTKVDGAWQRGVVVPDLAHVGAFLAGGSL